MRDALVKTRTRYVAVIKALVRRDGLRLLVEAAWRVLRTKEEAAAPLKAWAEGIAQRRGRSIAAVALARRLAGILYAMWRDGTDYRAPRPAPAAVAVA